MDQSPMAEVTSNYWSLFAGDAENSCGVSFVAAVVTRLASGVTAATGRQRNLLG
jgi:hypothetical protein